MTVLVLDFDGTMTDAEAEGRPFRDGYLEDLCLLVGRPLQDPEVIGLADDVERELEQSPASYPFTWLGRAVAPATVDPYLRMVPIAHRILDHFKAVPSDGDRSRLLGSVLYKYNYAKTLGHPVFRPRAGDVLRELGGTPTWIVTNSDTHAVAGKIATLDHATPGVAWLTSRVRGYARKFDVDDAWSTAPAELTIPDLDRPVLLRRRAYHDILKAILDEQHATFADLIVVGDIFELDLAMPLALGARVGLVTSARTPAYERAFVAAHPRGTLVEDLAEIPGSRSRERDTLCVVHRGVALVLGVVGLGLVACSSEPDDPYLKLLEDYKNMGDPAPDTSNAVLYDPRAIALGKQLYFDANFSGSEIYADMLLRPMTTPGRVALGQPVKVSCNTCHDVEHGGGDPTGDPPGNRVSFGAGAYDVNSQQTFNSAYSDLVYWNGRNDSLWSQIIAVMESHVSVNGSRMRVAWRMVDAYRDQYTAIWPDYPLPPQMDSITAQKARLNADGTCILEGGVTCPSSCSTINGPCLPRFPLEGRPGFVKPGQLPVCTWGVDEPILQPYKDAWDCMEVPDQLLVNRIYVNFAKAIEAYEYTLISKDSPFDKWAAAGFQPGELGPAAERGARLFVGKAACKECHKGPLFQDNEFHNIGIPQLGDYVPRTDQCPASDWCDCVSDDRFEQQNCLPIGARDGVRKLIASKFRRDSIWSDDADCQHHYMLHTDPNYAAENPTQCDSRIKYYSMTLDDTLRGAWKTPGLRDVALTAPYMHNGMYANLRDVIVAYNKGGIINAGGETLGTIDPKIKVLNLTDQEIDDLVAFMQTLTGSVDPSVTAAPVVPPDSPF